MRVGRSDVIPPADLTPREGARSRPIPHVLAWTVLCCALVVGFEFLLYEAALILFSHMDTPTCAGADTFCSPQGQPGMTGGAIVFTGGNLVAVAVGTSLLVLFVLRRQGARTR